MSNKLDQIEIPVPCPADWEEMAGNDRMRYCAECKKNVYNLSKMTRHEAEALIATKRGSLCARIVRNPDGTILTEMLPATLTADGRRASPVAAALVTAIIGLSPNVVAHPSTIMHNPAPGYALESGVTRATQGSTKVTATISGAVIDPNGAIIQGATVKLINTTTGEERIASTSQEGMYSFAFVEAGSYSLNADATGFAMVQLQDITVQQGEQRQIDLTMGMTLILERVSLSGIVAMPAFPLRQLYDKSELVVVARAGKSVRVEGEGEARLMKTRMQISSTHKGAERGRTINLYHWVYGEEDKIYNRGGNLLLFLKSQRGEQRGSKQSYELIDSQRGVKELPEGDLQVYLQRIDELDAMMSKGESDREEIVEWLVRCAEHPATRWDGVYDLELNAENLAEDEIDISTEEAEEPVDESQSQTAEEVSEEEATEIEPEDEDPGKELFARLLTAGQRERLSQALFNVQSITDKDCELIDLVMHWDDGRLAPFLLSQLRRMEADPPYEAQELIRFLSVLLEDQAVEEASRYFRDNISYLGKRADQEAEPSEEAEDAATLKAFNDEVRQNRSEMLRRFIAVVESKLKK